MLNWLYPGVFIPETLTSFEDAFSLTKGKVNTNFIQHVNDFLRIIMLRRMKESTTAGLALPPKKEVNIHLPLTSAQRSMYLEVLTGMGGNHQESGMPETPPTSPGSENFPPSSFDGQIFGSDPQRTILNMLMELRKVSRLHLSPGARSS
jgi:SNF2 family DNA or RNA helicase